MKGANLVTKLFRDIDHLGHLISTVTMVMDQDISAEHFRESFQAEITSRRIASMRRVPGVPTAPVCFGLNPRGPISCDVAHARGGSALRIDAFRIFTAGHFQTVLRAGEFHSL